MRSAKSINSLAGNQQLQTNRQSDINNNNLVSNNNHTNSSPTSPICRCRVMYLGSSVPHITKDGLQGIQEPLRELYPDKATLASANVGIDSWLSVWSNGILIENVDETGREVKRFFKIDALHYCAAVKYVGSIPHQPNNPYSTLPENSNNASGNGMLPKFLPLDSPHARQSNSNPPIFASILRRTTGIKVLECHAFICKREAAANALVRCCFHAYADTMYAKQIGADINGNLNDINRNTDRTNRAESQIYHSMKQEDNDGIRPPLTTRRSKSIANLNERESKKPDSWRTSQGSSSHSNNEGASVNYDDPQELLRQQEQSNGTMARRKSINENYTIHCDNIANIQQTTNKLGSSNETNLKKNQKLSKSMYHLNQNNAHVNGHTSYNQVLKDRQPISGYDTYSANQSTSASCVNIQNGQWANQQEAPLIQQVPQPFYNPYGSRVPTYPPQNLIDSANNGGTLRSIRSMAANSIASTLLRSKKHAKAMSMAQLNQDKITSFHQPHLNAPTMHGPMMMPPVPPMFLPNLQSRAMHINGSQTMKVSSKTMLPMIPNQPPTFEAMTPKEMKKLLKKSAKYGIDPSKFAENGLPLLPLRPPPLSQPCNISTHSKSGTMMSQPTISDIYGAADMTDLGSLHGLPPLPPRGSIPPELLDQQTMKPILVKPNPEFLKSKAGKKWLKQQKEFKKLLPPHLDGLPIVFGPPPVEALEPAPFPNNTQPPFIPPHPGVPIMDSTGYYNPHSFYGQNGRASAASTLIRYSPQSQMMHENLHGLAGIPPPHDLDYLQRNQLVYSNGMFNPPLNNNQRDLVADDSNMVYGNKSECGVNSNHRQYVEAPSRHPSKRSLMVEQSVISLGDENDYDEEDDEVNQNDYYGSSNHPHDTDNQSRHNKASYSNSKSSMRELNERVIAQEKNICNQSPYDQADDQGSYSSGIYKRGHMNERAFSYSIRQEHRSSGGTNSDTDYVVGNEHVAHNNPECQMNYDMQQQPNNIYHRDQSDEYYHDDQNSQAINANELNTRQENQLNMKSFANLRIKSHM